MVSRHDEDPPRVLVIYVRLTSEDRGSEYEVQMPKLPFLRLEGVANVQGIASMPKKKIGTPPWSATRGRNGADKPKFRSWFFNRRQRREQRQGVTNHRGASEVHPIGEYAVRCKLISSFPLFPRSAALRA